MIVDFGSIGIGAMGTLSSDGVGIEQRRSLLSELFLLQIWYSKLLDFWSSDTNCERMLVPISLIVTPRSLSVVLDWLWIVYFVFFNFSEVAEILIFSFSILKVICTREPGNMLLFRVRGKVESLVLMIPRRGK